MGLDLPRRRFLAHALAWAAASAGAPLLAGCSDSSRGADARARQERALVDALVDLLSSPEAAAVLALPESDMTRPQALASLIGDASESELDAVLGSADALRNHLEARQRADFAAQRVLYLDSWLLAESEVAVSVLLRPTP